MVQDEKHWNKKEDAPLPFDGTDSPPPPPEFIDNETGEIIDKKPVKKVEEKAVAFVEKREPASPFMVLLNKKKNALQNFLGDEKNALTFMSAVMHSMQKVPKLEECSHESLMGAFMECAAIGLYPGNASGDCYVLPYKGKAQFQLGYKGVKTLAYRSGVLKLWAEIVYKNDKFKEVLGTNPQLIHEPAEGERGEPVKAYACAEVNRGSVIFKVMRKDQIMKIKALSQSKDSQYSPWNAVDPDLWMWKKCAIKQLGKVMPQSDKLKRAIYLDNVSERGGYFEGENDVVEVPFDNSDGEIEQGKDKKAAMRKARK